MFTYQPEVVKNANDDDEPPVENHDVIAVYFKDKDVGLISLSKVSRKYEVVPREDL